MKKTIITLTVAALASTSAFAVSTAACAGCHGQNFEKKAMNVSKIVKDMSKEEIVTALKGYKAGTFGGAMKGVMAGQVKNLSDADIEAIAGQITGGEKKEASAADAVVDAAKEKATEVAKEAANSAVDAATNKAKDAATGAASKMMK